MEAVSREIRQAIRSLLAHPGFSTTAISTLALAIGFSTALFSVVNGTLLRPLPYSDPDQLVMVWERSPGPDGNIHNSVSPANAFAWRERTRTLAGLAALANDRVTMTGGGMEAEEIPAQDVTANVFSLLGVGPRLGRSFGEHDGEAETSPVVVISDDLWHRRFAADTSVIGRTVDIDNRAFEVIGVMPPGFSMLDARADVWVPRVLHADGHGRYLSTIGRLRPGVTIEQARAEFAAIAGQLAVEAPLYDAKWGVTVITLREQLVGDIRRTLVVTFAAVLLLLAIAYFNVANLFLNRAVSRRREIGVRIALGATRGRLLHQFFIEAECLAITASILGLVVAIGLKVALEQFLSRVPGLPRVTGIVIDWRVIAFLVVASLVATVLSAVLPAWANTGRDITASVGGTDRGPTSSGRQRRLQSALVAAEVALALVLLVGAGLLVRTMQGLGRVDLGMQPNDVLAFRVSLPQSRYGEQVRQREFYGDLLGRLQGMPEVRGAGAVRFLPLTGERTNSGYWAAGAPKPRPGEEPGADIRIVAGQYFEVMHIQLRSGRTFNSTDTQSSPDAVVINQALADRLGPNADPIGQRLVVPWGKYVDGKEVPVDFVFTVIGIVGNDREASLAEAPEPAMYWWYGQHVESEMSFVVGTGNPARVIPTIRAAVRDLDAGLAVANIRMMTNVVSRSLARPRATLVVLGTFAGAALLLAALGLYGVVAYWVSSRVKEIGVRIALGAAGRDVIGLVVWQALAPTLAGVVIGLLLAAAVTRLMASLLYGVSPTDPLTLASLGGFLCIVAIGAALLPGLRATRIDPARALQNE